MIESARTFKGMLVNDQEVVHLHLFSKGGLMGCRAAGEQLAGADAAGQGLRAQRRHCSPSLGISVVQAQGRACSRRRLMAAVQGEPEEQSAPGLRREHKETVFGCIVQTLQEPTLTMIPQVDQKSRGNLK